MGSIAAFLNKLYFLRFLGSLILLKKVITQNDLQYYWIGKEEWLED